jgi:hypothetical protein
LTTANSLARSSHRPALERLEDRVVPDATLPDSGLNFTDLGSQLNLDFSSLSGLLGGGLGFDSGTFFGGPLNLSLPTLTFDPNALGLGLPATGLTLDPNAFLNLGALGGAGGLNGNFDFTSLLNVPAFSPLNLVDFGGISPSFNSFPNVGFSLGSADVFSFVTDLMPPPPLPNPPPGINPPLTAAILSPFAGSSLAGLPPLDFSDLSGLNLGPGFAGGFDTSGLFSNAAAFNFGSTAGLNTDFSAFLNPAFNNGGFDFSSLLQGTDLFAFDASAANFNPPPSF